MGWRMRQWWIEIEDEKDYEGRLTDVAGCSGEDDLGEWTDSTLNL
jgi:hypothetical protein